MSELLFCQVCRIVKLHSMCQDRATCIRCENVRRIDPSELIRNQAPECGECKRCTDLQAQALDGSAADVSWRSA